MAKDKKARQLGYLTINALGVVIGSVIDTMRMADVPNDAVHHFLDELENGFEECLFGEAQAIMLGLLGILRQNVASND
jgi:hypothetical protein